MQPIKSKSGTMASLGRGCIVLSVAVAISYIVSVLAFVGGMRDKYAVEMANPVLDYAMFQSPFLIIAVALALIGLLLIRIGTRD